MLTKEQKIEFYTHLSQGRVSILGKLLGLSEEKQKELVDAILNYSPIHEKGSYEDRTFALDKIVEILQENTSPESIKELLSTCFENQGIYILATPLHIVTEKNNYPYTHILSRLGADVNSQVYKTYDSFTSSELLYDSGNTPLHLVFKHNVHRKEEFIDLFISAGADINALNYDGWSILDFAIAQKSSSESLLKLINYGAELGARPISTTQLLANEFQQPGSTARTSMSSDDPQVFLDELIKTLCIGTNIGRKQTFNSLIDSALAHPDVKAVIDIKTLADGLYSGNQKVIKEYILKVKVEDVLPRLKYLCDTKGISPSLREKGISSSELPVIKDLVNVHLCEHLLIGAYTKMLVDRGYTPTTSSQSFTSRITESRKTAPMDLDLD